MVLGAALYLALWLVVFFPASPFGSLASDIVGSNLGTVAIASVVGWNVLLLVVTILVLTDSFRKVRAGRTRELATSVFTVKLAAIPFFLINFASVAFLAVAGAIKLLIPGLIVIAIAVPLTWFAMLSTSIYGWATIVAMRRERSIRPSLIVLYSFMLALFVVDIAAGVELFGRSRRRPGVGLVTVLLTFWVALAILGFASGWLEWLGIVGIVLIVVTIVVSLLIRRSTLRGRVDDSPLAEGVVAEDVSTAVPVGSAEATSDSGNP